VHITLRMRLLCEVCRAGEEGPQQTYEVMNEVVVDRGANPYLTKIECWEHGRLITKVNLSMRPWLLGSLGMMVRSTGG
jgi:NAD+ kinase